MFLKLQQCMRHISHGLAARKGTSYTIYPITFEESLAAVNHASINYRYLLSGFNDNHELVEALLTHRDNAGDYFQYAGRNLRKNKDYAMIAIEKSHAGQAYLCLPNKLKRDPDIVAATLKVISENQNFGLKGAQALSQDDLQSLRSDVFCEILKQYYNVSSKDLNMCIAVNLSYHNADLSKLAKILLKTDLIHLNPELNHTNVSKHQLRKYER